MIQKLTILCLLAIGCFQVQSAEAQLLFSQTRADYRQPTTYSPEDPNFRSPLFLEQTGHSGRFYNCDGEEDKRFSPYIFWSTVDNRECIRTWANVLRCDIQEVGRRVRAGACCGDASCECGSCSPSNNEVYSEYVPMEYSSSTRLAEPMTQRGTPVATPRRPLPIVNSGTRITEAERQAGGIPKATSAVRRR